MKSIKVKYWDMKIENTRIFKQVESLPSKPTYMNIPDIFSNTLMFLGNKVIAYIPRIDNPMIANDSVYFYHTLNNFNLLTILFKRIEYRKNNISDS